LMLRLVRLLLLLLLLLGPPPQKGEELSGPGPTLGVRLPRRGRS
jgi:hypothetical protein